MYSVFQGARVSTSTVQCDLLPIFLRVDVVRVYLGMRTRTRARCKSADGDNSEKERGRERERENGKREREREKAWMRFSNVSLDWLDWKELARDGLSGNIIGW